MTTLIISNEEMDDIMKIIKSLREYGLAITRFSETIENESEEQKSGFLDMLWGTLGASLLGNLLTSKRVKDKILRREVIRASEGRNRAGKATIRAGQHFSFYLIL